MNIADNLLDALEVQVEPFAVCDVRCGDYLDIEADDTNTIHYSLAGTGKLVTGSGEIIPLVADQMILIPPGITQRIESDQETLKPSPKKSLCIHPTEDLHWLKSGDGDPDIVLACGRIRVTYGKDANIFGLLQEPLVESFADSVFIRGAFETMLQEFGNPQLGTMTLTSTLMKQCLILLLRRLHERNDWRIPWLAVLDNPRIGKALKAMITESDRNYRVEELAEIAHMSRSTFTDHFTRLFGQPPHDFLTNYRLRRAAHLLQTSDLAINTIANQVGYQSRSSFSRAFKSLYELDPAGFRKAGAKI